MRILILILVFCAGAASMLGVKYVLAGPQGDVTTASHGDWRLTCPPQSQRDAFCHLTQNIISQETGATLAQFTVSRLDGNNRLTITVPHGVALEAGLGLGIAARPQQKLPYETCNTIGCFVSTPLDKALGGAMRKGGEARIIITRQSGDTAPLQFSLRGFDQGITALERESFRRAWRLTSVGL